MAELIAVNLAWASAWAATALAWRASAAAGTREREKLVAVLVGRHGAGALLDGHRQPPGHTERLDHPHAVGGT
ncbi:MAG: hypothetical protein ACRD0D_00960 [Acidimicrobiales bacterium]